MLKLVRVVWLGSWDSIGLCTRSRGVIKPFLSLINLERITVEGNSPVDEKKRISLDVVPKYYGIYEPVGIREDHLLRLNTLWRPIVNQYREGKVKRTPFRGVKISILKP